MSNMRYCLPKLNEFIDMLFVTLVLGFLFSFTFSAHDGSEEWFPVFITFFVFIFILFLLRMLLMKFIAMRNGFEFIFRQSYFDRYWFRKYDRLSHIEGQVREKVVSVPQEVMHKMSKKSEDYTYESNKQIKGIPTTILSIVLFIATLGFFVYPNIWNFVCNRIGHLHIGQQSRHEVSNTNVFYSMDISDFRTSKVLIAGFFGYFIMAAFLKYSMFDSQFYWWFVFITYWLAFITIVPIPGSDGFELFKRNNFGWIMMITILILGMLALLVFDSFMYVLLITVFATVAILFMVLWRRIMG